MRAICNVLANAASHSVGLGQAPGIAGVRARRYTAEEYLAPSPELSRIEFPRVRIASAGIIKRQSTVKKP